MQNLLEHFQILRKEFLQSIIGVVLNSAEHVFKVSVRVNSQSTASLCQGINDGRSCPSFFVSSKKPIFSADYHQLQSSFSRIVVKPRKRVFDIVLNIRNE
jgi:hypothetical protein